MSREHDVTKELRRLMEEATPGPVKWWTSNSWRRLRRDGPGLAQSIAEPYVARDGHPDLDIKQADMDFIAALWNAAPALLSAAEEAERLREALTPSAATKVAFISEFSFHIPDVDEDGDETTRKVYVPWITVKEIMAAIRARALTNGGDDAGD